MSHGRVLQIIADGKPGGGTTHVLQLMAGLKADFDFGLITEPDSFLKRQARELRIPAFGLNFFSKGQTPSLAFKLRRLIHMFRPNLVHVHGSRAAFWLAASRARVPWLFTVHGLHYQKRSRPIAWVTRHMHQFAEARASTVIFVADGDARQSQRDGGRSRDARVIYNGIDIEAIPNASAADPMHVGFIGRLDREQKDPLLFLDCMERLPDLRATMVGGGALEPTVRQAIHERGLSDRVILTGELERQATLDHLSRFGVLLMTSRWEGLPLVALEAMAAGVPIVGPSVRGISEVVEHGLTGLLAADRSGDALAAEVARLVQNPQLRARIIEQASARVREKFDQQLMLRLVSDLYQQWC